MNIAINLDKASSKATPGGNNRLTQQLSQIVVGEITAIDTVLQSTGLKAVMVNCGSEVLTTACTADNLRLGMKTAFAKLGAILNDNRYVQIKEINGVECHGVLCSEYDLGLGYGHEHIFEIQDEAVNGTRLVDLVSQKVVCRY